MWGCLMGFVAVAILVPAIATSGAAIGGLVVPGALLLLAAAYVYAGYALRKERRAGGWAAVAAAGCMATLQLRNGVVSAAGVSLVVNLAILALVLTNWRHLRRAAGAVDA